MAGAQIAAWNLALLSEVFSGFPQPLQAYDYVGIFNLNSPCPLPLRPSQQLFIGSYNLILRGAQSF